MSYVAYEVTAGDALTGVQELCRHAARHNGAFATTTIPALSAVEDWLTSSYYWIGGLLAKAGLSATQTAVGAVSVLKRLNVLDACMMVELSMPTESSSGDPNERFKFFKEQRDLLVAQIDDGTLAAMGAATIATTGRLPRLSGVSRSRKAILESNLDATQHRVRREQFSAPGSGEGRFSPDISSSANQE